MSNSSHKRPFAVFDIDGTLIRWQLYHAITDALAKANFIDRTTHQAIRKARMGWKVRRHKDAFKSYERQLITVYDQALATITPEQFNQAATQVFNEYRDQVYTYTRDLIKKLKQQNYVLFAISGSQIEIVSMVAQYYGFDDWKGSVYPIVNGRFTGAKNIHIADKHLTLNELVKKHNVSLDGSIGVGDSPSDITLLETVEHPIAFNPDRILFERAKKSGWDVVVERKNVIYNLEPSDGSYLLA